MEAVIKFNIISDREGDWILDEYANGKIANLTDEHLREVIADIVRDAIASNGLYLDIEDAEIAAQDILPTISSIVHNPKFSHIKAEYRLFVEMVTYLTLRLA